jgi:hypothetical protein
MVLGVLRILLEAKSGSCDVVIHAKCLLARVLKDTVNYIGISQETYLEDWAVY